MDHAEIAKIRQQHAAGQWPQFLEMLEIRSLRGWKGETIVFQFPVTAIVGENGTGKSTVLKAAASSYEGVDPKRTYYPSTFFLDTHWDTVSGVTLSYRVKTGNTVSTFKISKPTRRWGFPEKRVKRNVFFFDISRVLPLDASAGYAKIAKLAAAEISTTDLADDFRARLSHVLGRPYSKARFVVSDADKKRHVGLLGREFGEISQYHQGAGEDATLDLMRSLQELPEYALLIIDEVEASLHPRAQRRLVRFLLWLARQKRMQVILSTHSPYVLEELPQESRVLLMPGPQGLNVVYGITPEFAMSRIDEGAHPELVVFVEDREASILLREILASSADSLDLVGRIRIAAVGPANVVTMLGELARKARLPYRALAVTDGDANPSPFATNLPGKDAPERVVFAGLKSANWPNLPQRFGIGAGALFSALEDAMLDPDPHRWNELVGDKVLKSASGVWEILATEWTRHCLTPEERAAVVQPIRDMLAQGQ